MSSVWAPFVFISSKIGPTPVRGLGDVGKKDAEQFLEGKIMKARKYLILTVVALVLFGTFYGAVTVRAKGESGGWEAYERMKRTTLRGLQGVRVFVTGPTREMEKYGLTTRQIKADVELRLRGAGIKTLSLEDSLTGPDLALFRVLASVDKHPSADLFLVNVHAELDQIVLLQRDLSAPCTATTCKNIKSSKEKQSSRGQAKTAPATYKASVASYLLLRQFGGA